MASFYTLSNQYYIFLFFFSSRRRHARYIGDWSSDVCSSDLDARDGDAKRREQAKQRGIDRDELAHVEVAEADSLLVSDYNEPVAVPLQFREPLSDTGQQLGFSRIPQVRALSEQRAVAIQKHNPLRRRTDYR